MNVANERIVGFALHWKEVLSENLKKYKNIIWFIKNNYLYNIFNKYFYDKSLYFTKHFINYTNRLDMKKKLVFFLLFGIYSWAMFAQFDTTVDGPAHFLRPQFDRVFADTIHYISYHYYPTNF